MKWQHNPLPIGFVNKSFLRGVNNIGERENSMFPLCLNQPLFSDSEQAQRGWAASKLLIYSHSLVCNFSSPSKPLLFLPPTPPPLTFKPLLSLGRKVLLLFSPFLIAPCAVQPYCLKFIEVMADQNEEEFCWGREGSPYYVY